METTRLSGLARHPRLRLLEGPTPIQRLHRVEAALGEALGGVRLFAKRDDLMGLGGGGNKLRKLEFLLADAQAQGADTFISVGGLQSNHARLSAAASVASGLACELVLSRQVPRTDDDYERNGNRLLDDLFGARVHVLEGTQDPLAYALARADELRAEGRKAYVVGSGGSSPVGCLGYAACAEEILAQEVALGVTFREIVLPNGSSGTQAGLVAGFTALGVARSIRGFAVLNDSGKARAVTVDKVRATLDLIGAASAFSDEAIVVDGSQLGAGYGVPTEAMVDAVRIMAGRQGLLIDPVYGGKAFAGLLAAVREGRYREGDAVLFMMTGGVPGLFAYRSAFAAN
jgi:L-cysteate sulfo-lyase